jgi:hypothetical protein
MAVGTRVRVDARGLWAGTLGSSSLRWVVVLAVLLVVVLDAGSVFMTRISLSDDGLFYDADKGGLLAQGTPCS